MITAIMELWTQLRNWQIKTEPLVSTLNMTASTNIWPRFYFREKEQHLSGQIIPMGSLMCGTTRASLRKHVRPSPKQACRSWRPRSWKSWQKKTCYLPQSTEPSGFPNDFCVSGDTPDFKFCQHNIDWKRREACKDHLLSKAHENTRKSLWITARTVNWLH